MRIGYVIGSLARAGAELQLIQLASGLAARGHEVRVLAYDRPSEMDDALRATGVDLTVGGARTRSEKMGAVRRWLRSGRFDVVHPVLNYVSSLTLLARLPALRPPVVVTDYSQATYAANHPRTRATFALYALAARVVTETEANAASLAAVAPWLRRKVRVVRNGLDLERFATARPTRRDPAAPFVFCVVGTVYDVKNPLRIADAAAALLRRGQRGFVIEWHGRVGLPGREADGRRAVAYAAERGVGEQLRFLGETRDIAAAYRRADALLHVSLREGFPNAVAEAMASGLPVVVSRVADLPLVVREAHNGVVVDETDAEAIADGMEHLLRAGADERAAMAHGSRALAARWFAQERYLDDYERLYLDLLGARRSATGAELPERRAS